MAGQHLLLGCPLPPTAFPRTPDTPAPQDPAAQNGKTRLPHARRAARGETGPMGIGAAPSRPPGGAAARGPDRTPAVIRPPAFAILKEAAVAQRTPSDQRLRARSGGRSHDRRAHLRASRRQRHPPYIHMHARSHQPYAPHREPRPGPTKTTVTTNVPHTCAPLEPEVCVAIRHDSRTPTLWPSASGRHSELWSALRPPGSRPPTAEQSARWRQPSSRA